MYEWISGTGTQLQSSGTPQKVLGGQRAETGCIHSSGFRTSLDSCVLPPEVLQGIE